MDLQEAKRRLTEREAELVLLLASAGGGEKPVELDQSRVGRLSRMDALAAQAMAAETQRRRRVELSRVRAALSRVDTGTWGECLSCGEEIAERRLEHDPACTQCIECAGSR